MSQQIQITGGAKVRDLQDVIIGTSGVLSSLAFDVANGVPKLDSNGKILVSQLPNSVMEYKGTWNAATNTPTLANGTGNQGDVYLCNVAGTVNFGAGPIAFFVGDQVIYSGSIWQRASGATGTVTSVAITESGDSLNITGSPITTSGTINIGFNGTNLQYVNGAGNLTTFPILTGYVTAVSGTAPVVSSGGTTPAISMAAATGSVDGYLSATDFAIFSAKQSALTFSSPLVNTSGTISIPAATTSVNGYLASADFTTFNNKQNAITLTTTGTSGVATFVGATLNIPNYGSALTGYVPYTGATQDVDLGAFSLNGKSLHIKGTAGNGHLGLKHQSAAATGSANESLIYADSLGDLSWQNANLYLSKFITSANTANRSYTFPNATGTVALTSDLTGYLTAVTATSPLSSSGGTTPNITIAQATTSANGYLSSTDWTTFNSKQGTITLTTTGTSGAATFTSNTLNIPDYGSALSGYLPLTGGTLTGALNGTTASFSSTVTAVGYSKFWNGTTGLLVGAFSAGAGYGAIYSTGVTPSTTNFALATNGASTAINATNDITLSINNGSQALYLNASGNLGLGVTPSAWNTVTAFQVGSTSLGGYSNTGYLSTNAFYQSGWKYINTSFAARYEINSGDAGVHAWYNAPSGTAGNAITFTQAMTLTAAGNLGIGTSSPTPRDAGALVLELYGTSSGRSSLKFTNSTSGTGAIDGMWMGYDDGLNFTMVNNEAGYIALATSNTERMRITSGGNIAIGMSNPQAKFVLQSAANYETSTLGSASANTYTLLAANGLYGMTMGVGNSGNTWFQSQRVDGGTSAYNLLLNPNGGNVLIGTTTDAGYKLDVNGTGRFVGDLNLDTSAANTQRGLIFRDAGTVKWQVYKSTANDFRIYRQGSSNDALVIGTNDAATFSSSVTATSFFESSDSRLKTLIQDNYQTKGIASITPKLYTKNGKVELGYYAQDFVGILDSAVSKGEDDMLSLSYREVLVAKVYALEQEIKELKAKMN